MKKTIAMCCVALSLTACGGMSSRDQATVVGAGVGTAAGAALTGDVGGAVVGGVVVGVVGTQIKK